jgi:hypothetical protein
MQIEDTTEVKAQEATPLTIGQMADTYIESLDDYKPPPLEQADSLMQGAIKLAKQAMDLDSDAAELERLLELAQ